MKPIDFDGLFDEKLAQYIEENRSKYTEKQWENLIPGLYKKFGDTYLKRIKCTPKEYYARMTDGELAATLSAHLGEKIPVPDFLCAEIEKRGEPDFLLPLLDGDDGETASYVLNLVGGSEAAYPYCFKILVGGLFDEDVRDAAVDVLKEHADAVFERALEYYREGRAKEYMLEIFSRVKTRDDEVYDVLLREFLSAGELLPLRAGYLASYGDERALPYLLDRIRDRSIGFVEFQELKYAIESLGGEYNEPRSFGGDKDFRRIEDASLKEGGFGDMGAFRPIGEENLPKS